MRNVCILWCQNIGQMKTRGIVYVYIVELEMGLDGMGWDGME